MPPKKTAIKGEPDFHLISDEKLSLYLELTQQMIFSYSSHDPEKVKVLEGIWKELSCEEADRSSLNARKELEKQSHAESTPAPLLRKVPKVRKSPAKVKI